MSRIVSSEASLLSARLGDEGVAVVVPTAAHPRLFLNRSPNCLEAGRRAGWVGRLRLPKKKHVPFRSRLPELLQVPLGMRYERSQDVCVQGNRPAIPRLGLGLSYGYDGLVEVNSHPLEVPELSVPHPCVQGQHQGRIDGRRAPGGGRREQGGFLFGREGLRDGPTDREFQPLLAL